MHASAHTDTNFHHMGASWVETTPYMDTQVDIHINPSHICMHCHTDICYTYMGARVITTHTCAQVDVCPYPSHVGDTHPHMVAHVDTHIPPHLCACITTQTYKHTC